MAASACLRWISVELPAREHVGPAHHRVQGRAQLVGQRCQEVVLQAVRALRVGAGDALVLEQLQPILGLAPERLLDPALRGGIAEHQHRADHAVVLIADRGAAVRDGSSVPSGEPGSVWFASPTTMRSRSARSAGLGAGSRVSSRTTLNTSLTGCPVGFAGRPSGQVLGDGVEEASPGRSDR